MCSAFAVSLGAGKLVPALTDETRWPLRGRWVGFALLGVAFVAYGYWRQRLVESAVARGEYARPDERLLGALTWIGMLLGFVAADRRRRGLVFTLGTQARLGSRA